MKSAIEIHMGPPRSLECTAYHEAGHAVLLDRLGKSVSKIRMECDRKEFEASGENAEWRGCVDPDWSQLSSSEVVQVAWAGPLAEMKFRAYSALSEAIKSDPIAIFYEVGFVDDLFQKELEPAVEEFVLKSGNVASGPNDQTLSIAFGAMPKSSCFSLSLPIFHGHGDGMIAMDAARKELMKRDSENDPTALREVLQEGMLAARRELDVPETWEKVIHLSNKLLSAKVTTPARIDFPEDEVQAAIKEANKLFRLSRG